MEYRIDPLIEYPYTTKRIGATLVDYTIIMAVSVFYIVTVGTLEDGVYRVTGLPALVPEAFWFVYIIITERYSGGTLGHQLFKLKVVSLDGNELTFWQVFLRRIADALEISWCFGLIAFALVKSTDRKQRLGDLWAKTLVVGQKDTGQEIIFDFEKTGHIGSQPQKKGPDK